MARFTELFCSPVLILRLVIVGCGFLFGPGAMSAAESRTWTSADGKKLIGEAKSITASEVQVILKDGRAVKIPVARLSEDDQAWVKSQLDATAASAVELARLRGATEGPYAGKLTGEWQKLTSALGIPFALWGPAPAKIKEKDKGKAPAALPLVIYLHGAGGRGDDNEKQLEPGARVFTTEANQSVRPCLVLAPQCPAEKSWGNYLPQLFSLIRDLSAHLPIDRNRLYVHGFSMGGHGTYQCLENEPTLFAAGVPVAGGGNPKKVALYHDVPVWAFVGEKDEPGTVASMKNTAAAITAGGGVGKITAYPDGDHLVHDRAAKEPELHTWLFQQTRKKTGPG
jgi:predicted esterase